MRRTKFFYWIYRWKTFSKKRKELRVKNTIPLSVAAGARELLAARYLFICTWSLWITIALACGYWGKRASDQGINYGWQLVWGWHCGSSSTQSGTRQPAKNFHLRLVLLLLNRIRRTNFFYWIYRWETISINFFTFLINFFENTTTSKTKSFETRFTFTKPHTENKFVLLNLSLGNYFDQLF